MSARYPGLTARQKRLLHYIRDYSRREKRSPLLREMMVSMEVISLSPIYELLDALEDKGFITRPEAYKQRNVSLTDKPDPENCPRCKGCACHDVA